MENNRKVGNKNNRNNNNNTRNANNQGMQGRKRTGSNSKLDNKDNHKKVGINARNDKAKYSDDEIARARYVDSKSKFLVRDRIHNDNIDTINKWIGISNLQVKDKWDRDGNYDPEILSFDAEIFDRTEQTIYDESKTSVNI